MNNFEITEELKKFVNVNITKTHEKYNEFISYFKNFADVERNIRSDKAFITKQYMHTWGIVTLTIVYNRLDGSYRYNLREYNN